MELGTIFAGSAKDPRALAQHRGVARQIRVLAGAVLGKRNIPEFRKAHGKEDLEFEVELRARVQKRDRCLGSVAGHVKADAQCSAEALMEFDATLMKL